MRDELNKHKKDVQEAVLSVNNRANETITNLNKEIGLEKVKMKEEHAEVVRELSEQVNNKEEQMQEALCEIEQREQSWRDEKEDILREIQRLKAEAGKMVSILAAEYEEENLSEEKKRSLSAEVYSLQLVVEMRTAEVRSLREKLATASHQLEDAAVTRNSLQKADAKIEDLEEQLKNKIQLERFHILHCLYIIFSSNLIFQEFSITKHGASAGEPKLDSGGGQDEPGRGAAPVEDQEQLRRPGGAACLPPGLALGPGQVSQERLHGGHGLTKSSAIAKISRENFKSKRYQCQQ